MVSAEFEALVGCNIFDVDTFDDINPHIVKPLACQCGVKPESVIRTTGVRILMSVYRITTLFPASCLLRRFDIARYAFNILEINLLGTKPILRQTPMNASG